MFLFKPKLKKYQGKIGNNDILIDFNYSDYNESKLLKDMKDLKDFQTGKDRIVGKLNLKQKEAWQRTKQNLLQLYKNRILSKEKLDFDTFKKISEEMFLSAVKAVLLKKKKFITANPLEIQIKVVREPKFGYYAAHDEEASDSSHIYFEFVGSWLLLALVYPQYYCKYNNLKELEKFFWHEFTHHMESSQKRYSVEEGLEKKFGIKMKEHGNYSLLYQHLCFENLRVEGSAEFRERTGFHVKGIGIEINLGWLEKFVRNVKKLSKIRDKEKAEDFFNNNLQYGTTEALYTSTSYAGRYMAYVIGLAFAKKSGLGKEQFFSGKGGFFRLDDFKLALERAKEGKQIFVKKLPPLIFNRVSNTISKIDYQDYIKLYEKASDYFEVPKKFRFVTWEFYEETAKRSKEIWEKEFRHKVKSEGFEPDLFE